MRNDDALTADEVAGLLQVSRSSVYKLVKADELASAARCASPWATWRTTSRVRSARRPLR